MILIDASIAELVGRLFKLHRWPLDVLVVVDRGRPGHQDIDCACATLT